MDKVYIIKKYKDGKLVDVYGFCYKSFKSAKAFLESKGLKRKFTGDCGLDFWKECYYIGETGNEFVIYTLYIK